MIVNFDDTDPDSSRRRNDKAEVADGRWSLLKWIVHTLLLSVREASRPPLMYIAV